MLLHKQDFPPPCGEGLGRGNRGKFMVTAQTSMQWETGARGKYDKMLTLIPLFHRGIAKEVVNKKAEQNAQARGAAQVGEEDIVQAFLTEVPKAFYSLMIRIMDEVGFNYKQYK